MKPLEGVRIVEMAGLGPVPFAAMWFADVGAEVIRIERVDPNPLAGVEPAAVRRGRRVLRLDLKAEGAADIVLALVATADALLEGFRPGVMERLGLGPDRCLDRNPSLVYGRMTGWGQDGPWADMAGHDIDYIALSGLLHAVGPAEKPVPPLNLVGDYGGGAMMLIAGVLAGIVAARDGRPGRVVDAAMTDGAAYLGTTPFALMADGWWQPNRESNLLDGGAPFYRTYETSDGQHMAVGALEPQFYSRLLEGLGLDSEDLPGQQDVSGWPTLRERFAVVFASRTRAEWEAVFAGTDACVAPVLSMAEAADHPHMRHRATFVEGVPAPAPRFVGGDNTRATDSTEATDELLESLGIDLQTRRSLRERRVIG
ncbi:MAG: CaiB/BaiF CoA transferase family protein [Acidimicrobiia bacterium]